MDTARGIDEDKDFCGKYTCQSGTVKLIDGVTCAYDFYACNGRQDYPNGIDEDKDFCESFKCPPGYKSMLPVTSPRKKCPAGKVYNNAVCVFEGSPCPGEKGFRKKTNGAI